MRYRFFDGYEFEADGPDQIVEQLWQSKFVPEPTLEEWMAAFVNRARMWDGSELRTSSAADFVDDLLTAGHLVAIS